MRHSRGPLVRNTLFATYPILVHASGKSDQLPLWPSLLAAAETWAIDSDVDPHLSIVTFNNGGTMAHPDKRLGLLEGSLRRCGIDDVVVLGQGMSNWRNVVKIRLLLDFLDSGQARDYVLLADSADVILSNDIGPLVPTFKKFGCRALFNAERRHWPNDLPRFDEEVAPGEFFPCLNSGVWIADTPFARQLVEFVHSLSVEKHAKSDQARYKVAYREFYPQIRVDHRCVLFQNINRVDTDVVTVNPPESAGQQRRAWGGFFSRPAARRAAPR